jgi:hypothetical protein
MAAAVPTVVVRFDAIDVAVFVTTDAMPPTSFWILDWTSPVRVRVKKASDWRCRWLNRSTRSRCMTRCPVRVLIQVCTTPKAAVNAAIATMAMTSQTSSRRLRRGIALSITARSRNGEARPTSDDATMSSVTSASGQRKGQNSFPIRRRDTLLACSRSALVTERGPPPPRPPAIRSVCRGSKGSTFLSEVITEVTSI